MRQAMYHTEAGTNPAWGSVHLATCLLGKIEFRLREMVNEFLGIQLLSKHLPGRWNQ